MLRKRYLFLIIFISLITISSVSAEELMNESDTVSNEYYADFTNDDLLNDSCGTFDELQNEIDAVESGGILNLTKNYKYVNGSNMGISLKSITINGCGFCIDGDGQSRIFRINSNNVVLNNITFINAKSDTYGGAIVWYGNNGEMKFCTFYNNTALEDGGAVYAHGDILKIQYCNFTNNEADTGGAIYCYDTNLKISDSIFVKNIGWDRGGAIHCRGPNSEIENCTFIKNEAVTSGAINFDRPNCIVNNSKFIENIAYRYGGAFWWIGVQGILNNSMFFNNRASESGKAISWDGAKGTLQNLIYYSLDTISVRSNVTLINNTEVNNTYSYLTYILENYDLIKYYNQSTDFSVRISRAEGGYVGAGEKISFIINNDYYESITNSNGYASFNEKLQPGEYIIKTNYNGCEVSNCIKIFPTLDEKNMQLSSFDIKEGENEIIKVVLPSNATGEVSTTINNIKYFANINNGIANISIPNLNQDYYSVEVTYSGDSYYNSVNGITSFIVYKTNSIVAPNVTKYCGGPERFIVFLNDEDDNPIANANIKININGVDYDRTTGYTGQTSIALGIPSGNYTATVEYDDIETESNIVIKPTVWGNDISKIFRNGTQYYAQFVDTSGNSLVNTQVEFNINGVFYTRTTNQLGVARMNINLNPGEYIITATNPYSNERCSNIVTVLSPIVENHDLIKYYRNDSQYVIKVLDDYENPVGAGVNVDFNINGVFYTRTSNATGHVKMNINLAAGQYIITAEYNNYKISNLINVLPILKANDLSMNVRDGSKFEVKVLDGQGKAYSNQVVTFNINGVFYDRVSDDDGIARLNINLNPGNYIITSNYATFNIANKISINPVDQPNQQQNPQQTNTNNNHESSSTQVYIGNINSKIFHNPSCSSVEKMKNSNKITFYSRNEAINHGYTPCKICKP